MAQPKRRWSKARTGLRRSTWKLENKSLSTCSNCGEAIMPHKACPSCGQLKLVSPAEVFAQSFFCKKCSDGISYPEKMFTSLLSELNIDYIYQLSNKYDGFEWCKKYRYDFYLPDTNTIVEVNGGFHYDYEYKYTNAKSLQEVKNNDINKMNVAIKNGITNYVQIDARESDFHFIKENIINSDLSNLYNLKNVNWINVGSNIVNNMLLNVCNFYNKNQDVTIQYISTKFKIHYDTVSKYLKRGSELGLCLFNSKAHQVKMVRKNHFKRPVVCITTNKTFDSVKEAGDFYHISPSNIFSCCVGRNKTCGELHDGTRLKWAYA